jgi:hypothetical protein
MERQMRERLSNLFEPEMETGWNGELRKRDPRLRAGARATACFGGLARLVKVVNIQAGDTPQMDSIYKESTSLKIH